MGTYTAVWIAVIAAFLVASLFVFGFKALSGLAAKLRPHDEPSPSKGLPFECGNPPQGAVRQRFNVKFYVVALLFVLFDVEIIFLYPLAVVYRDLGWFGFIELALFMLILGVGYLYVWKKKALEWT